MNEGLDNDPAIEARGLVKQYGGEVFGVDGVDLSIPAKRIYGMLGPNGAGKTTCVRIVSTLLKPDEGEILFDGKPAEIHSPKDAIDLGIGMVHQHFMLVPVFTVAENVVLGVEPTLSGGVLNIDEARQDVRSISEQYNLAVDPDAIIEELPVGIQQRVEIIKVLFRDAEILVFDEPTAVLTPQEVEEFFKIIDNQNRFRTPDIDDRFSHSRGFLFNPDYREINRKSAADILLADNVDITVMIFYYTVNDGQP